MSNIFDRMAAGSGEDQPQPTDDIPPAQTQPVVDVQRVEHIRIAGDVRQAIQELLRLGYLEEKQKSELFRTAIVHEREINAALEPLDLAVKIDSYRGIALIVVRRDGENATSQDMESLSDEWAHPLVRRQRLTLEQSLLIAILRGAFVLHEQESGVGGRPARIAVDELLPQYLTYIGDSGSDARNETRLNNLLEQLKGYGIVSEVDAKQEITIRPLIAHIANPESLAALLQTMTHMEGELSAAQDGGEV